MDTSIEEYFSIARHLEKHHSVFSKMWEIGHPVMDKTIPTAAILFDRTSGKPISYLFNPDFYAKLSTKQKCFVIAHECLHLLLKHGKRAYQDEDDILNNICLDIAVNEILIKKFLFDESYFPMKEICTIENVFKDKSDEINELDSYEYYFNKLKNKNENKEGKYKFIDSHEWLSNADKQAIDNIIENVKKTLSDMENTSLEASLNKEAGNDANYLKRILSAKYMPKRKWETVIKKWVNKKLNDFNTEEQWVKDNRRIALAHLADIFIPTDEEIDIEEKNKITVWFFQDTSGSCSHLAERFFKAAKTIPEDTFDVKMFCFDTKVYETSLKSGKLYGFGGTSFSIIEQYIQNNSVRKGLKYPDAVFVITDGEGDKVSPAKPKNWHWFLSQNSRQCIHTDCNIYDLGEFE